MEPSRTTLCDFSEEAIVAPFVDNQLVAAHPALAANNTHYDTQLHCYVPREDYALQDAPPNPSADEQEELLPPRPLPSPVNAMRFWDDIFDDAMAEFKTTEDADPNTSVYTIRSKASWDAVFSQLELGRNKFNTEKGVRGKMRKIYRRAADNVQPAIELTKLVPDVDYATPVLGTVEFLLEAVKKASEVRKTVLEAFDDLQFHFSVVELFLETYPKDQPIRAASVSLVSVIFRAVELAIFYFTTRTWKRAVKITSGWNDYGDELIAKMGEIQEASQKLIQQAELSDMVQTRQALSLIIERMNQWKLSCKAVIDKLEDIKRGQQSLRQGQEELKQRQIVFELTIKNSLLPLLGGYLQKIDHIYRHTLEQTQSTEYLQITDPHTHQHYLIRSRSPSPIPSPRLLPCTITPQHLLDILDIPPLEQEDILFITNQQTHINEDDKSRAEQIIQTPQFREWTLLPAPARLLIHGDFAPQDTLADISALSLLCATLYRSLGGMSPRFIPIVFFCGRHASLSDTHAGAVAMVRSFVAQLLRCEYAGGFDLSRLPAGTVDTVIEGEGGTTTVLGALCDIFWGLVRQLPRGTTVFAIVDGVGVYERERFVKELDEVLMRVLEPMMHSRPTAVLAADGGGAVLKVMITSPFVTSLVKEGFADEWILSMQAMPPRSWGYSEARLEGGLRGMDLLQGG